MIEINGRIFINSVVGDIKGFGLILLMADLFGVPEIEH